MQTPLEMYFDYRMRIVVFIVTGLAFLGAGWGTNLSAAHQPHFLVYQGTARFASARGSMEAGATGTLTPGQQLETGVGSTAILFLPNGAAMALTPEGRLRWNSVETAGAVPEWRFQLGAGSLIVRLPEDRSTERLRLQSAGGEVQAEEGTFVMSVFHREDVDQAQLIGVESGSVRFLKNGGSPRDPIVIHGGDAVTLRRFVEDGSGQSPISHQIFTGDLRYRFLAGLEQISQAQRRVGEGAYEKRSTRAPTSIPEPDHLPDPSPGAGSPAPHALLIEAQRAD